MARQPGRQRRWTSPTRASLPLLALITLVNGIAEELFFRGAAYAATTRYPVVVTTVAYTLATLATGNVMLAFAAVLLGMVVGLQRRASGGILAPILTHCTWSLAMLFALPLVFSARARLRLARAPAGPTRRRAAARRARARGCCGR